MDRRQLLKLSALLLGATASLSVSRALLAGTGTTANALATVFTAPQRNAVSLLAEMIIPTTDSPGAVAAGVPEFIATIVGEWYTATEREIFFKGLAALDDHCRQVASLPFTGASEATRTAALSHLEQLAAAYKSPLVGGALAAKAPIDEKAPFFTKLKELVVLGYYSSEVGSKQELAYLPMPGEYIGDYDFAKVGRPWSL